MSNHAPPDPGRGPPDPPSTGQQFASAVAETGNGTAPGVSPGLALYQRKNDEVRKRNEDMATIMKMISVEDGTRQGTRTLVLKDAPSFGKDRATSLRFSALNATKPIGDTSGTVLELTMHHKGVASERDKVDAYSKVLRTLSPDTVLCFNLPARVVLPPELAKYAPVIHGVTPEAIQINGNTRFKFVVRCASVEALDTMHEAATKIEWQGSPVQYTSDHLWAKLQGLVAQITAGGHSCTLLQLQQPLHVVQDSYLVTQGNYAAIVQFDDDDLFKNNGAQLRQVLPTRIDLRGQLATLTPLRHDYEAEASCC